MDVELVIPSLGRPSLGDLLAALAASSGPLPAAVIVVDDRRGEHVEPVVGAIPPRLAPLLRIVRGAGAGPAAARNRGWRSATAEWVAFLDDDVIPDADWLARLDADLAGLPPAVAASQGRLRVPLSAGGRAPTDWERSVAALEHGRWITADMAYRRDVLEMLGGFDERFPRAYREDSDLGLRIEGAGLRIERGERCVTHPPGRATAWISVRRQAGNADDVLMRALHGRGWRERAGAGRGRKPWHVATTAAGLAALGAGWRGRPVVASLAAGGWLAGTARLVWLRVAPGPRTPREVATMVATSVAIPPAATAFTLAGLVRYARLLLPAGGLRGARDRDRAPPTRAS